jgi:hypothetical protein
MKKVSYIGKNPSEEGRMSEKVVPLRIREVAPSDAPSEPGPKLGMGKLLYLVEERRSIVPQDYELRVEPVPLADRKRHQCSNKDCQETVTLELVWYDTYLKKTALGQKIEYSCGRRKCTGIAKRISIRNCRAANK